MKLYNATYYHGSGAKFDKFDFSFMGSGEGAQAHGWGIYLAQEKTTAEGYRDSVGSKFIRFTINDLTVDITTAYAFDRLISYFHETVGMDKYPSWLFGRTCIEYAKDKRDYFYNINNYVDGINNHLNKLYQEKQESTSKNDIDSINIEISMDENNRDNILKCFEWLKKQNIKFETVTSSMLATVRVDDDCMFVDELDKITTDHPCYEAVKKTWCEYGNQFVFPPENEGNIIHGIQDIYYDTCKDYPSDYDLHNFLYTIQNEYSIDSDRITQIMRGHIDTHGIDVSDKIYDYLISVNEKDNFLEENNFRIIYHKLCQSELSKTISISLLNNGVDGITYDGQRDGRCLVLLNLDKCQIVEKE